MARMYYCFRCHTDVPMLEAHEWDQLQPLIREALERDSGRELTSPREWDISFRRNLMSQVFPLYEQWTGRRPRSTHDLLSHVVERFGPPCASCGKPLRTPRATLCVECGTRRNGG